MKKLVEISGRSHTIVMHRIECDPDFTLPVLWLTKPNGDLEIFDPLFDYFADRYSKSSDWKRKAARALGLFYDFSTIYKFDAEASYRNRHAATLTAFVHALQFGTIPKNGAIDPTGLNWPPMQVRTIKVYVCHLDQFIDYTVDQVGGLPDEHPLKMLNRSFECRPIDGNTTLRFLVAAKKLQSKSFMSHLMNVSEIAEGLRKRIAIDFSRDDVISGFE